MVDKKCRFFFLFKMSHGLSDPEIIVGGTHLFQQFYNIADEDMEEALKNYQGFDLEGESEDLCKMMKCNIDYYFVEPQPDDVDINTVHFDLVQSYVINPEYPTFNILLTKAEKGVLHASSITDIEELVG